MRKRWIEVVLIKCRTWSKCPGVSSFSVLLQHSHMNFDEAVFPSFWMEVHVVYHVWQSGDPCVLTSAVSSSWLWHFLTKRHVKQSLCLCSLHQQLSTCLTALIKTEKEAEVRRAAVHVIALLLRGLSDKTTQVHAHSDKKTRALLYKL